MLCMHTLTATTSPYEALPFKQWIFQSSIPYISYISVICAVAQSFSFFKESSEEEREHTENFMEYQNKRGGRVKLQSILMPLNEFDHPEKGDALYAMELALSLEKVTNEKLINLRNVAERCNDVQMVDFVESNFLGEQVDAIKKISEYVAQLRRVGKGHGVWHFDQMLLQGDGVV